METPLSSLEIGALVIGLTELIKFYGLSDRLAPLCAIFLGISFSVFFAFYEGGNGDAIVRAGFEGLLIGLTATGLYKGGKTFIRSAGVPAENSTEETHKK